MSFMSRLARIDKEAKLDHIIRNLNRVFNSRKRYGSAVGGWGPDDHAHTWTTPERLDTLRAELLAAVQEYERELLNPEIVMRARDRHLWIRLLLTGVVDGETLQFHIDIDGKYHNILVSMVPGGARSIK